MSADRLVLAFLAAVSTSFLSGLYVGKEYSWSYLDYHTVERRMREVFCEQALHNGLLKKCDPKFPRAYGL